MCTNEFTLLIGLFEIYDSDIVNSVTRFWCIEKEQYQPQSSSSIGFKNCRNNDLTKTFLFNNFDIIEWVLNCFTKFIAKYFWDTGFSGPCCVIGSRPVTR